MLQVAGCRVAGEKFVSHIEFIICDLPLVSGTGSFCAAYAKSEAEAKTIFHFYFSSLIDGNLFVFPDFPFGVEFCY